jgi:hypothetical protein
MQFGDTFGVNFSGSGKMTDQELHCSFQLRFGFFGSGLTLRKAETA